MRKLMRAVVRLLGVDRWDVIALGGAGLLGGGIWRQWGAPWACMAWGLMLLALAGLNAVRAGQEE